MTTRIVDAVDVVIEVDTSRFAAAMLRLTAELTELAKAVNRMRPALADLVRRAAIERGDIPESDIRRIEFTPHGEWIVVLWNRRRIPAKDFIR